MPSRSITKYRCEEIAKDVTRLLNLTQGLTPENVHDYYQGNLLSSVDFMQRYDIYTQGLIDRALMREFRYLHVR